MTSFVGGDGAETADMAPDSLPTARVRDRARAAAPAPAARGGVPALGDRIGRYVALRVLGEGGMGVVIAAHDPELERQVAIKLVHPSVWRAATGEARDQLRDEARAMARLIHPNVVAVHDLGTVGDQLFVAMELVTGTSLDVWLAQRPRPWREVLAVCLDAGRGLAAAHRAGLVHRDVKPRNVLVDDTGRPRIADFGLAALTRGDVAEVSPGGTPAYMSPEQHWRTPVGPSSDQFNYCVMVYEALYGERPFAGSTRAEIADAVTRGRVRPPPPRSRVPRAVRRALLRGLAPESGARFPSMVALLAALAPRPVGRWVALAAAVVLAGGAGAASVALAGAGDPARAARAAAEARAAAVWSPAARKGVVAAIARDPAPHAAATAERVAATLDRYVAGWIDARATLAGRGRSGEEPPLGFARRSDCLDRRLAQTGALVQALTAGGPGVAARAIDATAALDPVAACVDGDAAITVRAPPDGAERRARYDELVRRLDEVTALDRVGRARDAADAAAALLAPVRALDHPPLTARAIFADAGQREHRGDVDGALLGMREAIVAAAASHDDELAARAWVSLVALMVTAGRARPDDDLLAGARAAVVRAGTPPSLEVALDNAIALVAAAAGRPADAEAGHRRAIARAEAALPADHRARADLYLHLATALTAQHRSADALAAIEHGLAVAETIWGKDHPQLALYWSNIAAVAFDLGDYARAEPAARRAAALAEPGTKMEGVAKLRLAGLANAQGRDDEVIVLTSAAAELFARTGNRRLEYEARLNRAIALYNTSHADAGAAIEQALALGAEVFAAEPHALVHPMSVAGLIASERGDFATAIARCQRAADLLVARFGRDDPELITPLLCVASARRRSGDARGAQPVAIDAQRLADRAALAPLQIETRAERARVLRLLGDRRGARALLREALAVPGLDPTRRAELTDELAR